MTEAWIRSLFPLTPFGRVAEIRLGKMLQPASISKSDDETPYLRAGHLAQLDNLTELPTMFSTAAEKATYAVEPGDLVVAEGGDVGRTAFVAEVPPGTIIQNSLHRVRSKTADVRFLRYCLDTAYSSGWLDVVCNRSTFGHLTGEKLAALRIPLPDRQAQSAISDFLDAETARIGAVIEKKQRMIELLDERVWTGFTEDVLRSERTEAPLRRALAAITDGPFGSAFSSADYSVDGAAVVRLGNIGFAAYRGDEQVFVPLNMYPSFLRHRVLPNDLLIAGLGDANNHAGRACVAPKLGPAIVKGKCFCAQVRDDVASADYLALLLSSRIGADAVGVASRGSTRSMINLDIIKSTVIPLPPLTVQQEIVRRVRSLGSASRQTSAVLRRQIHLLAEHRQALITAAVTGELDVSKAAA
jgi:type I restriction enzyme, S subunit